MPEINSLEIANVLVSGTLFFFLLRSRDALTPLLILFAYGTLHFVAGSLALSSNDTYLQLVTMHNEGGGLLAKLSAFLLLSATFIALSRHTNCSDIRSHHKKRELSLYFLLSSTLVFVGYILCLRPEDSLQIKNFVSIEAMLAFTLLGLLGIDWGRVAIQKRHFLALISILILTDAIAIYEVSNHQAWSVFSQSTGEKVFRASSLLFNPNLLGLWAALIYLGLSHYIQARKENRNVALFGMVLTSITLYLSGSRSALFILLVALTIPLFVTKANTKWHPITVLLSSILLIYEASEFINPGSSLALLGTRFSDTPIYAIQYMLMKASSLHAFDSLPGLNASIEASTSIPIEVSTSIEGRFSGSKRDSGWLVLFQDTGWLGVSAMSLLGAIFFTTGIRTVIAERSANAAYALATLVFIVLIGFTLRVQIFPTWLFASLSLIPCLLVWYRPTSSRRNTNHQVTEKE